MKIYDISVPLSNELPTWPGDPPLRIEKALDLDRGDPATVSLITLGSHTGTHLDAPGHFIRGGKTIDQIPLDVFMGRVRVYELNVEKRIEVDDLKGLSWQGIERVLFKTRNSLECWKDEVFHTDFVHLSQKAAEYLVEKGIKLIGIDYLSVEAFGSTEFPVHHTLLSHEVIPLEGLNLWEVKPGDYEICCLPIKIKNGDGAPVRAILKSLS
jgi:arylformamidase